MKEHERKEPTIIELLNDDMRKGTNNPDNCPTIEKIAERMGIPEDVLNLWLESDREFRKGLTKIKEVHDEDPWKDTLDDEIKLDAATLSFGIAVVLEETKKRYTV
jgi:hypothetical protein